ncbi:MAG: ABC transporter permease [Minwuia sp.]|uniref:ABC transporter permease n=1 Tax=Minwuia sp. TaxID=2493630 RepID=UPI003A837631
MTIDPANWEVALAAVFLIANAVLSLLLDLGFVRQMSIAAIRMVIQLSLVGLVLEVLITSQSPGLTALAATVMVAVAGYEIMSRQEHAIRGIWGYGLGAGTMLFGAALVMMFALNVVIRQDPWYDPRYAIPMFGMMLGNAMTGIAVGLNALSNDLLTRRAAIEAHLLTGATRWQALAATLRRSANAGLIPIINAMAATGVVSLPGMMTGQILAGADPSQAVRYQLLVMFLISGATGIGLVIALMGAALRLTDSRHRIRLDRLKRGD